VAHALELCGGPVGIDGGGRLMEVNFDFGPPKLGKKISATGKNVLVTNLCLQYTTVRATAYY
jgi:hypothetical protein